MGRLTTTPQFFLIHGEDIVVESHSDFVHLLRRSRILAETRAQNYEIRNEEDVILAVTISSKKTDGGMSMSRAAKHNAKITLVTERDKRERPKCPQTDSSHVWRKAFDEAVGVWRCEDCGAIGYSYEPKRILQHKCSTCGEPATHIRKGKRVPHHRWSCEAHVEL